MRNNRRDSFLFFLRIYAHAQMSLPVTRGRIEDALTMEITRSIKMNVLAQRYLDCRDDKRAEQILEELLRVVEPLIKARVRRKRLERSEAEDVCNDAKVLLSEILQKFRASGQKVRRLEGLVAYMVDRAFSDALEDKYRERYLLKDRTRYALEHDARLALWPTPAGTLCCLQEWGEPKGERWYGRRWEELEQEPRAVVERKLGLMRAEYDSLPVLIVALLTWLDHPVPLEALVTVISEIQGVTVVSPNPDGDEDEDIFRIIEILRADDDDDPVGGQTLYREFLHHLWSEICRLRDVRQRRAVHLDFQRVDVRLCDELLAAKVALHRDQAATLEIEFVQFAVIWNKIPLTDDEIAPLCDTNANNVRQLRIVAFRSIRKRLQDAV